MSARDNNKTPNPGDRDNAELEVQPMGSIPEATAALLAPAKPTAQKRHIYPSETFVRLTANQMPFLTNRILVPQDVCDALVEEAIRQRAGYQDRAGGQGTEKGGEPIRKPLFRPGEEEAFVEESGDDPDPSPDDPHVSVEGNRATRPRRKRRHFKPGTETGALAEFLDGYPERLRWRVIRLEAYQPLDESKAVTDHDVKLRNREVYRRLQPMGEYRRVGRLPRPQALDRLRQSHPHFHEVIDFVADRLGLAQHSRKPVRIPPMLLAGPPGVGKTHFCNALAQILGVPCRRHQMDQAETSSSLLGSEKTWSNTRVGLVFEEVVMSEYANPIIILDELDKAPKRSNHSSPAAVLHTLLEPVTASQVRDLSVDIEFDASLVTWMATCNYPWQVAPTLLSRMKCFWISLPDAKDALLMARSVAEQAVKDANVPGFQVPGREILVEIAHYSAREVYQIVGEGIARCVKDRRKAIETGDIAPWVVREAEEGAPDVVLH